MCIPCQRGNFLSKIFPHFTKFQYFVLPIYLGLNMLHSVTGLSPRVLQVLQMARLMRCLVRAYPSSALAYPAFVDVSVVQLDTFPAGFVVNNDQQ